MSAISPEDVVDSASIAAASAKRPSLFRLAIRNPSVIFGGAILTIMIVIAALAPVLGTVDPTRNTMLVAKERHDLGRPTRRGGEGLADVFEDSERGRGRTRHGLIGGCGSPDAPGSTWKV